MWSSAPRQTRARCLTTPHRGTVNWQLLVEHVRAVGADVRSCRAASGSRSTHRSRTASPLLADRLRDHGSTGNEVDTAAVTASRAAAPPGGRP